MAPVFQPTTSLCQKNLILLLHLSVQESTQYERELATYGIEIYGTVLGRRAAKSGNGARGSFKLRELRQ